MSKKTVAWKRLFMRHRDGEVTFPKNMRAETQARLRALFEKWKKER